MRNKKLLTLIGSVCVILVLAALPFMTACPAPPPPEEEVTPPPEEEVTPPPEKEMITWTQEISGKTLSFERGAKLPGMKPGEEDIYITWRWNTTGRKGPEPPELAFEELEELTKGHFRIEFFFRGALGSVAEAPYLVGSGLYESHQCSLGNYPELMIADLGGVPFTAIPDQEINARWALYYTDLPVVRRVYDMLNLFPLLVWTSAGQYLWTAHVKAEKVDDLKGLMCATKGAQAVWVEDVGMVPVIMKITACPEGLTRGMIEGALTWPAIAWYGIAKPGEILANYCLQQSAGGNVSTTVVNKDAWEALPDYMKDIFLKYRSERFPEICGEYFATGNDPTVEGSQAWEIAQSGVEYYTLPPEEAAKYEAAAAGAFDKWIEGLVAAGMSEGEVKAFLRMAIAKWEELTGKTFWYEP